MAYFNSIILGFVQGISEFLPISSSGHLVILQKLIPNFTQSGVIFDSVLHLGTLVSVVFYYRRSIIKMNISYAKLIVIGSIPAAIAGYLFQGFFESLFANLFVVGFALLITSLFNYATDKLSSHRVEISNKTAIFIGIMQAFAIIPGLSRSASTIFAGVKKDIRKDKAAEFSFILSVPAVLGANFLQIYKYASTIGPNIDNLLIGFLFSAIFGVLSLKIVISLLLGKYFRFFSFYCLILGIITILLGFIL